MSSSKNEVMNKYKGYISSHKVFMCSFEMANAIGDLIHIDDEGVKFILNSKEIKKVYKNYKNRDKESFLGKRLYVLVKAVNRESGEIELMLDARDKKQKAEEIQREKEKLALINQINAELQKKEKGKDYCLSFTGVVSNVKNEELVVKIGNKDVLGILKRKDWSVKRISSLVEVCKIGDTIPFDIVKSLPKIEGYDLSFQIDHKEYEENPWDELRDSGLEQGGMCTLRCINRPKGKTYWWGRIDHYDIDIMGDYPLDYTVTSGEYYVCEIRELDIANRVFRVNRPIAVIKDGEAIRIQRTAYGIRNYENKVREFYNSLEYEEAYKYVLKLIHENSDNSELSKLFDDVSDVYESFQRKGNTIPSSAEAGVNFAKAYAADLIENNSEKAEKLYVQSIRLAEPRLKQAINSLISILCKQGKYEKALDAHTEYIDKFDEVIDKYLFRIRKIDILKKLELYNAAIDDSILVVEEYRKNKDFLSRGGLKRLSQVLHGAAAIYANKLKAYEIANELLDKAFKYGLDERLYASSYINNCVMMGQKDEAQLLLSRFEEHLTEEYIASINANINSVDSVALEEDTMLLENNLLQMNLPFFENYVSIGISKTTEDITNCFENLPSTDFEGIRTVIECKMEKDTNLSTKKELFLAGASFIYEHLDGYASSNYYQCLIEALQCDIEIHSNVNKHNYILNKYAIIACLEVGRKDKAIEFLKNSLLEIQKEKEDSYKYTCLAFVLNNNAIVKDIFADSNSELLRYFEAIVGNDNNKNIKDIVNNIIESYSKALASILDKKNILLNYLSVDLKAADNILIDIPSEKFALLQEDIIFVNRIIEINRILISCNKISDYIGITAELTKSTRLIDELDNVMGEYLSPLSISLWSEVLNMLRKTISQEKDKIEVTLAPRVSIALEDSALFPVEGIVNIPYLIRNEDNCAPIKDIIITFEDNDGNPICEEYANIEKLLGGETFSSSVGIARDKDFSFVVHAEYIDNKGNAKGIRLEKDIIINKTDVFIPIVNPFTTSNFRPDNPNNVFVGRDEIINELKSQIIEENTRCVVLFGQKRTGKTSIFEKLIIETQNSFIAVRVSMALISSMEVFYKAVKSAFERNSKNDETRIRIKKLAIPTDMFEFEDFIDEIRRINGGKRILLLLDEFSHLYDLMDTDFPEQFMNNWKEMMEYNLFSAIITGQETISDLIKVYANQFAVQYTVPVEYIEYRYFGDLVDKPIRKENGESRFKEKSFDLFWKLTKGHPYLTQSFASVLVRYLNANKMENIYDVTINKVLEEYINASNEKDFDSFYCRYSKNDGDYSEEVQLTLHLLFKIAEECSFSGNNTCDISRLNLSYEEDIIKTSLVRRGIISIDDNRCEINVKLFYEWLIRKGKNIFSLQKTFDDIRLEKKDKTEGAAIVNNYNITGNINNNQIEGNYIENQVNNVSISIDNVVTGLERIENIISSDTCSLTEKDVKEYIDIPFDTESWKQLGEEERESQTEEYAQKLFNSEAFSSKELTVEQKVRFSLSEDVLKKMSEDCRRQIICGIQVYDLIQYCIDNFGLEMNGTESARAILFARAFEKHMKDCMYMAFGEIPVFAQQILRLGGNQVAISDYPVDRTTIGNYTTMLEYGKSYNELVSYATTRLGYTDKNVNWWKNVIRNLKRIGALRNECCHSGSGFESSQLNELIDLIFVSKSIEAVYVVREIYDHIVSTNNGKHPKNSNKNSNNQTGTITQVKKSGTSAGTLDDSLIGKECTFKMKEKTPRGNIRGIVNGRYPASLPKVESSKTTYSAGKKVKVLVDSTTDGKYIVKII